MTKWLTYLLFLIFFSKISFTQNDHPYGQINIHYFDPNEYQGESQNWDISQTSDGLIVLANNKSAIVYNGTKWLSIKLDNKDEVRSLATINNTTYIGGHSEFGKIYYDSIGTFSYQKLSDTAVSGLTFVIDAFNTVNFVSKSQISTLKEDTSFVVTEIPEGFSFQNVIPFNNAIILDPRHIKETPEKCLLYDGSTFHQINNSELFHPKATFTSSKRHYLISNTGEIRELIISDNTFSLEASDLYKNLEFNGKPLDIYTIAIRNNIIAVGTDGNGIYLFDSLGNFIRHINSNDGLSNLQIRKLFFDNSNNLWSANDEGIYLINLSNPIVSFDSSNGITSSVEDFKFTKDETYILTHDDLFHSKIIDSKKIFINTNIFKVDLYGIEDFTFSDGTTKTFFITNNGIEILDGTKRTTVNDMYAWDFVQSSLNPNLIWYGLNDGIGYTLYDPITKKISTHYLKNTYGEVRKLDILNDEVYYSVKNQGIVKLDSTKQQDENLITKGLTTIKDAENTVFTLCEFQDKIYVGTSHGLYQIKEDEYVSLTPELTKEKLWYFRLYNDNNEKLWVVTFEENEENNEVRKVGYLEFTSDGITQITKPFKTLKEDIIQVIKEDLDGNLWFGGKKKAYLLTQKKGFSFDNNIQTIISSISSRDSIISNYLNHSDQKTTVLSYNQNMINFTYSTPSYFSKNSNTYSYFLEGWDEKWSDWSYKTEAPYQRLKEGTYTFHVKSRNYYDSENKETTYTFVILPPWYRTIWAYFLYFFLSVFLIYIIIKLSLKRVKDQNERLEKIVEERTAEVEHQKSEIEHKNRDIVDSIIYAKRIQNTILPTRENTIKILKKHFVIYKPKDIVSGDFFWIEELDGKAYFSAIDCTGHGVPGAFVSIVGFNGIKRTVNEFKERQPAKILDKLTDILIETFTASESHLKDGMDMALCSLDYNTLKLEFSGANNPLILIRDGELIETKGSKQPIGDFGHRKPFVNHEIQLQKEDSIFVFTDGFADQFGGPKGKKLKLKTLKNLLVEVCNLPIKEQKVALEKAFNDWKGDLEQLDDVCLIGLKI